MKLSNNLRKFIINKAFKSQIIVVLSSSSDNVDVLKASILVLEPNPVSVACRNSLLSNVSVRRHCLIFSQGSFLKLSR